MPRLLLALALRSRSENSQRRRFARPHEPLPQQFAARLREPPVRLLAVRYSLRPGKRRPGFGFQNEKWPTPEPPIACHAPVSAARSHTCQVSTSDLGLESPIELAVCV